MTEMRTRDPSDWRRASNRLFHGTASLNDMIVKKWWIEFYVRGKREKPREKFNQTLIRPPRNPHGVIETRTLDPSGGRRATNRLRHEVPIIFYYLI